MGFKLNLSWLVLMLMSLIIFKGCGDLEPDMQDTRTVILNMDFLKRSSSRSISSVSSSALSQYNTHLIFAVPDIPDNTQQDSNYFNYNSSYGQEWVLMDPVGKVTLEIPLDKTMKIFAFLFETEYSLDNLTSGTQTVGYYGESQTFSIDQHTNTNNYPVSITLQDTGNNSGSGGDQEGIDTTPPTVNVTTSTITTISGAVVQSTEIGTAYLVNTSVTVSNLSSITGAAENKWNSVEISSADNNTYLSATGLIDGTYKGFAEDTSGNLSIASSNSVNVVTNYALNFDGSNDYVSIPNDPFSNNNTFTIQVWLKPEAVNDGAYHGFVGIQNNGRKPSMWVSTNGNLHYDSLKGSQRFSGTISDGSNKFFTVNEWIHVVWTNDASNYRFFKNGNPVGTETAPDTFYALDNIGYEIGRVDNYFNGQIDEVAIWDAPLSSADITALFNSGNGLKASVDSGNYVNSGNLVGYWRFNEGIGSTLTDNTSNSNNGTLTNMDSNSWVTSGINLAN